MFTNQYIHTGPTSITLSMLLCYMVTSPESLHTPFTPFKIPSVHIIYLLKDTLPNSLATNIYHLLKTLDQNSAPPENPLLI